MERVKILLRQKGGRGIRKSRNTFRQKMGCRAVYRCRVTVIWTHLRSKSSDKRRQRKVAEQEEKFEPRETLIASLRANVREKGTIARDKEGQGSGNQKEGLKGGLFASRSERVLTRSDRKGSLNKNYTLHGRAAP